MFTCYYNLTVKSFCDQLLMVTISWKHNYCLQLNLILSNCHLLSTGCAGLNCMLFTFEANAIILKMSVLFVLFIRKFKISKMFSYLDPIENIPNTFSYYIIVSILMICLDV